MFKINARISIQWITTQQKCKKIFFKLFYNVGIDRYRRYTTWVQSVGGWWTAHTSVVHEHHPATWTITSVAGISKIQSTLQHGVLHLTQNFLLQIDETWCKNPQQCYVTISTYQHRRALFRSFEKIREQTVQLAILNVDSYKLIYANKRSFKRHE
jgi:hypothetical protein